MEARFLLNLCIRSMLVTAVAASLLSVIQDKYFLSDHKKDHNASPRGLNEVYHDIQGLPSIVCSGLAHTDGTSIFCERTIFQ